MVNNKADTEIKEGQEDVRTRKYRRNRIGDGK